MTQTHGTSGYLTLPKMAKEIGIHNLCLQGHINNGLLDGLFVHLDSGIQVEGVPDGAKVIFPRANIAQVRERIILNNERMERLKRDRRLITDFNLAKVLSCPIENLTAEIEAGLWTHAIVDSYYSVNGRRVYALNRERAREQMKYLSMCEIARALNIPEGSLHGLVSQGRVVLKRLEGTNLYEYDRESILDQYRRELMKSHESKATRGPTACAAWLGNSPAMALIAEYLTFRQDYQLIGTGAIYQPIFDVESHKRMLSTIACALICRKLNIDVPNFRRLSDPPSEFDAKVFSFYDIDEHDIRFLRQNTGWAKGTYLERIKVLKPLISYMIRHARKAKDHDLVERLTDVLEIIPSTGSNRSGVNDPKKVFLSREEGLRIYHLIRTGVKSHPFCVLRSATMWMIFLFLGVRPLEIVQMRIHDFVLDTMGYLKVDNHGWGMFKLPDERSKQRRTGSIEPYGNPVVPRLVALINEYLTILYQYQAPGDDGWLFRPESTIRELETPLRAARWIGSFRPYMDFLGPDVRSRVEQKTGRRTMNEWIAGTELPDSLKYLSRDQKRAAEIQMRHRGGGDVNTAHYRKVISVESFRTILDATLNFPWDTDQLEEWEIDPLGYSQQVEHHVDTLPVALPIDERVQGLQAKLDSLKLQPKGMSTRQWIQLKADLRHQIEDAWSGNNKI